jgi:hypothetical protein
VHIISDGNFSPLPLVATQGGNLLVSGTGGSVTTSSNVNFANTRGIRMDGGTLQTTGTGSLVLLGTGGTLDLTGTSFGLTGGIAMFDEAKLQTENGPIQLTGSGGLITGSSLDVGSRGVSLGGRIESTGSGSIEIRGTAATSSVTGSSGAVAPEYPPGNFGALIDGLTVLTNSGSIYLSGQGGAGTGSQGLADGVILQSTALIRSVSGPVRIEGTPGSSSPLPSVALYINTSEASLGSDTGTLEIIGNGDIVQFGTLYTGPGPTVVRTSGDYSLGAPGTSTSFIAQGDQTLEVAGTLRLDSAGVLVIPESQSYTMVDGTQSLRTFPSTTLYGGPVLVKATGNQTVSAGVLMLRAGNERVELVREGSGQLKLTANTLDIGPGVPLTLQGTQWSVRDILNAGSLTLDSASPGFSDGRTPIAAALLNSGLVTSTGSSSLGQVSNAGTLAVSTGTLAVTGYTQAAGLTRLGSPGTLATLQLPLGGTGTIQGGLLSGAGTWGGNLQVTGGTLSPGFSPGALSVTGQLLLGPSSTLIIDLGGTVAGTGYDVVTVGGNVTLGGTLALSQAESFLPQANQSFTVISASGSVSGRFETPAISPSLGSLNPSQLVVSSSSGSVTGAIPAPTPAPTPASRALRPPTNTAS